MTPDIPKFDFDVDLSLDGLTVGFIGALVGFASLAAGSLKAAVMWVVALPTTALQWLASLPAAAWAFLTGIPGGVASWLGGLVAGVVPSVPGIGSAISGLLSVGSGAVLGGALGNVGLAPLVAAGVVIALVGYSWRRGDVPALGYTAQLAIWFAGGYVLVWLLGNAGVI